jgi:DNA-binding transcriptional ArsR family regulator
MIFMDPVFKALADPTRRQILDELADRDGQTLYELCVRMVMKHQASMSRQGITKHLSILESAGLIRTTRRGKYKLIHLQRRPISHVSHWIRKFERKKGR